MLTASNHRILDTTAREQAEEFYLIIGREYSHRHSTYRALHTDFGHLNYTHYWRIIDRTKSLEIWPQIVTGAQHIVNEAKVRLSYDGSFGEDEPPH